MKNIKKPAVIICTAVFLACLPIQNAFATEGDANSKAKDMLRQTMGLNEAVKSVGTLNSGICTTCTEPTTKPQFESCTEKNSYLQNELNNLKNKDFFQTLMTSRSDNPTESQKLQSCIRESMSLSGGPFRTCEGDRYSKRKVQRSCMTEDIVTMTQNSFDLSMRCLSKFVSGKDSSESLTQVSGTFFSLINLESGFHSNAVSGTGAGGLGQLTSSAIEDVNRLVWNDLKSFIDSSENASCAQIKKMNIEKMSSARKLSCDRIGLGQGNPMKNLLATIGYQKIVRNQMTKAISRGSVKNIIDQMPSAKQDQLINALMKWGHNTGPWSIIRPFLNLATTAQGSQLLKSGDIDGFLKSLSGFVKEYHISQLGMPESRAKEASTFYTVIQNKLAAVQSRAGGKTCAIQ